MDRWTSRESRLLAPLATPWDIQRFLDRIPYSTDPIYRSPRSVLRDRRAHCVDGALLAAAAIRRLGRPPVVTWITSWNDDGHLLALFRDGRCWGAVGKSNFANLRFRPPVFRSLRELVMSYFNDYFNSRGDRTMRGYTRPLNLARFDSTDWMFSDAALPPIIDDALDRLPVAPVLSPKQIKSLPRVDRRTLQAGLLGANPAGLWKPSDRCPWSAPPHTRK